ncbi:MAG TPA: F0F1 ATP synthase subunit epsilon [Dehalococcoidia bacterium]|nr:F0F1 ATP synthase subunit epsilon [Dehalococcoidia bacterium]
MPLTVEVITAERRVLSEAGVDEVIVPGAMGELAILPRHAALITALEPGEMRLVRGGDETSFVLTGGFLEVKDDKVTVLADAAERAEEIDVARAEEARRRAQERLAEHVSAEEMARAEAALRRSLMRLRVAERRRRRGGSSGMGPGSTRPGS